MLFSQLRGSESLLKSFIQLLPRARTSPSARPPPAGVKWCRHTLRPQTRPSEEDPEAFGESPRHHFSHWRANFFLSLFRPRCSSAPSRPSPQHPPRCGSGKDLRSSPRRRAHICMYASLSGPCRHTSSLEQ